MNTPETINIEKYAKALNNLLGIDSAYLAGDKDVEAIVEVIVAAKKFESKSKELAKEKSDLEYTLLGVMHSVDKWLEGDELKQDEVNRAAAMREKTLRIAEELTKRVEELENELSWATAYAVHYTSDECPNCGRMRVELYTNDKRVCEKCHWCIEERQYRNDNRL